MSVIATTSAALMRLALVASAAIMWRLASASGVGVRRAGDRRGRAGARPHHDRRPNLRSRQAARQGRAGELLGDLVRALPQGNAEAQRVLPALSRPGPGNDRHQHRFSARLRKGARKPPKRSPIRRRCRRPSAKMALGRRKACRSPGSSMPTARSATASSRCAMNCSTGLSFRCYRIE